MANIGDNIRSALTWVTQRAQTDDESSEPSSGRFDLVHVDSGDWASALRSHFAAGAPQGSDGARGGLALPLDGLSQFIEEWIEARGNGDNQASPRAPPWMLPGDERYPHEFGRAANGHWLNGPILPFSARGTMFYVPIELVIDYEWWNNFLMQPATNPRHVVDIDPHVFGFLLEVLVSPSGLQGTEPGMNLVTLTAAMAMSISFGMEREFDKLSATLKRYIVQRVLHRNPHLPDPLGAMDHEYFVFRSEELYRAHCMISAHEGLAEVFNPVEIGTLYWLAIPRELWPALTADFDEDFSSSIDAIAQVEVGDPASRFSYLYKEAFRSAGYMTPGWAAQPRPAHGVDGEQMQGQGRHGDLQGASHAQLTLAPEVAMDPCSDLDIMASGSSLQGTLEDDNGGYDVFGL